MNRVAFVGAMLAAGTAAPALAQSHAGHASRSALDPAQQQTDCEAEAARHRAMGHAVPTDACAPPVRSSDERGGMDHSAMDHGATSAVPIAPPPASAGFGPPRAADAIWGAEAMRASRAALGRENGGMMTAGLVVDRFEYRARAGEGGFLWDADAWYGSDINRIWLESEGEGSFEEGVEEADIALLYGRAITPWFDVQAGVRQDLTGPMRTYFDLGLQGLAPYLIEVEADLLLSNTGDLTAVAEVELDQRVTQRLIVQPRAEISLAAQDVPELGIGAGVDAIEAGVRLRYEIAREFAPYVGIEQEWKVGGSADYARAAGEDPSVTNYVVGVRFWF